MCDDDRKNATIKISMTTMEKEALVGLARRAGVSVSELVRLALVYQAIDLPEMPKGCVAKLNDKDRRTTYIHVQLTPDEKQSLRLRAKSLGCSMSDLVRRSAIEGKIIKQNEINITEVRRVYYELRKHGTNLNQLMYFINLNGMAAYDDGREVMEVLQLVRSATNEAMAVLEDLRSTL